jgi:inner membrane protein
MENTLSAFQRFAKWLKQSLGFKLFAIGFLVLLLMIPVSMIKNIISERQWRQETVIKEVSRDWGGGQVITGPILTIPYSKWVEYDEGKRKEEKHFAHFLPLELDVSGDLTHQIRQRGIFEAVLYQSDLILNGRFEKPDFDDLHVNSDQIFWDQAKLSVGISGMTGIKDLVNLTWDDLDLRMESGTAYPRLLSSGVSVEVPIAEDKEQFNFKIPLKLNGSEFFRLEPVGKLTTVSLKSDWHSPSFEGAFLPDNRAISEDGFSSNWQILDLNRNYPQRWKDVDFRFQTQDSNFAFGVRFLKPVDEYLKNTRSAKYALLVIGLTFLIFFFFEVLRRLLIHPFQYLLIGLALSIFYLLLLSLSEHFGFNIAYLIASSATIILISGYSLSVLKIRRLVFQLTFLLIAIYSFIFIILQLEDFALLAGSIGMFIALAATMFYSRKVDWYHLGNRGDIKKYSIIDIVH